MENAKSTIYGKKMEATKLEHPNYSKKQDQETLSMSPSMPLPTIHSALNRRIGPVPFMQSNSFLHRSFQRRGDEDISDGIDGGLLGVDNTISGLDGELGTRLLASKKAVNVLTKVREMQDEITELNKQIEEENRKFEFNKAMKKDNLDEEIEQTRAEFLENGVKPTIKLELAKENERNKIISSLSDSKKSIIEMLANSDSTPASNLGDALKMLLEKRQQREKKERKNEAEKQKLLMEKRELEQKLKEEQQRRREQDLLKKQKELLTTQQSLLKDAPRKQGRANFQAEREQLIADIAKVRKKQKQGRGRNLRKKLLQRLRTSGNKEAPRKAHLRLALSSNKRIIDKIGRLKEERRQTAALRQKQMIDKQLNELNALRILQRKRLQNLRKKNNQGTLVRQNAALLQQRLKEKLPPQSPILRLSTAEREKLLSFMDFERNADILQKTNDKIKAKAQKQKLKEDATKQTLKVLEEFNEYEDGDLTDAEIDEILLGFLGGSEDYFDFDYAYDDYFGGDELDIYDVLYDEYDAPCDSLLCGPEVPFVKPKPIPRPRPRPHIPQPYHPPPTHIPPPYHPSPTYPPKYPEYSPAPPKYPAHKPVHEPPIDYYPVKHHHSHVDYHHDYAPVHPTPAYHHHQVTYHEPTYEPEYDYVPHHSYPKHPHLLPKKPTTYTTIHGGNPSSFPPKNVPLQHSIPHPSPAPHHIPDYDYYDYDPGFKSGPEFLDEVSGIIGGSEAAGLPPHVTNHYLKDNVLLNIQHKLRSALSQGPPNHFRSHVEIGVVPHSAKKSLPPLPHEPIFGRKRPLQQHRKRNRHRHRRPPSIPFSASHKQENVVSEKDTRKIVKTVNSIKGDPNSVSFSEIMADFLTVNPLPFKDEDEEASRKMDSPSKTENNKKKKTIFLPFKKK